MTRLLDYAFFGLAFAFVAGLVALAVATTISSLQIDPFVIGAGALAEVLLAVVLIIAASMREAASRASNKRVQVNG